MDEFFNAAASGNLDRLRELLPQVDLETKFWGLHRAVSRNRYEVAEFLLAAGVPPEHDSCKIEGIPWQYPLHKAAEEDPRLVALLLKYGANPGILDYADCTPLSSARSVEAVRLLVGAGADVNLGPMPPLFMAAGLGQKDIVRELLTCPGIQVNIRSELKGFRSLHYATLYRYNGCVEALLGAGADSSAVDDEGRTHLGLLAESMSRYPDALKDKESRTITLLVAAGARERQHVPSPCPGLEKALLSVWKTTPEYMPQLVRRLEPVARATLQETLRALHHGARPFKGLDEPLRMEILAKVLE